MTGSEIRAGLKANWHLLSVLVAVLGAACYLAVTEGSTVSANDADSPPPSPPRQAPLETVKAPVFRGAPSSTQEARAAALGYESAYHGNPDGSEAALNLRRAANLYYLKLRDWERAATLYEMLLLHFPEDAKRHEAYPNLADCYEQLNDRSNAISVYRKMLDVFPEGSQYRLLAMEKLNQ